MDILAALSALRVAIVAGCVTAAPSERKTFWVSMLKLEERSCKWIGKNKGHRVKDDTAETFPCYVLLR